VSGSCVICFQLFLAVQNSSLYCLILQTGISYHIILMQCLHYKHAGLYCNRTCFNIYCTEKTQGGL